MFQVITHQRDNGTIFKLNLQNCHLVVLLSPPVCLCVCLCVFLSGLCKTIIQMLNHSLSVREVICPHLTAFKNILCEES